jgi:hypothetical protein
LIWHKLLNGRLDLSITRLTGVTIIDRLFWLNNLIAWRRLLILISGFRCTDPLDFVKGCFQMFAGDDQDRDIVALLDIVNRWTFFVEQVSSGIHR